MAVEEELGTRLPTDYKEFIEAYGEVSFTGAQGSAGLYIQSFLDGVDFVKSCGMVLSEDEMFTYPTYPATDGFLAFGTCEEENMIGWLTLGRPDEWPIVYYQCPQGEAYNLSNLPVSAFVMSFLNQTSWLFDNNVLRAEFYTPPFRCVPEG